MDVADLRGVPTPDRVYSIDCSYCLCVSYRLREVAMAGRPVVAEAAAPCKSSDHARVWSVLQHVPLVWCVRWWKVHGGVMWTRFACAAVALCNVYIGAVSDQH